MTHRRVDLDKLRVALRRMKRGSLLIVAERAIELVPKTKLHALVGDMIRLDDLAQSKNRSPAALLDEVRKFHSASLSGEYYDSFDVNSSNFMELSEGTEAHIAEFDRLLSKCIDAVAKGPRKPVREALELLFALLRKIDTDPDDIVFFADEGGSWQYGVHWHSALTAYFQCLAEDAPAKEFSREVGRAIADFADYDRPKLLSAARSFANAEQQAALRRKPDLRRRR